MDPEDPLWDRFDEVPSAEAFGYVAMFASGLFLAAGVAAADAVWVADPDGPPLGVLLVFIGAAGIWCWYYDRIYRRLRRTPPTSRWARLVGGLGRAGKRVGRPSSSSASP